MYSEKPKMQHRVGDLRTVSLVIRNWNGVDDTIACIESVHRSSYLNYDIIVVDNNSEGNDVEILKKKFGTSIYIIENDRNCGAGGGANVGIKYVLDNCSSDCILLLDNDTVVDEYFLEELLMCMETYDSDMVSSMIYYYDNPNRLQYSGDRVRFWRDIVFPFRILFREKVYGIGSRNSVDCVEHVSFWSTLIKKNVFTKIGFFDGKLFWGLEDIDFCWRAVKAGITMRYAVNSKVWHKGRSTKRKNDNSIHYYSTRNKFVIARRYSPHLYWLLVIYMIIVHTPLAAIHHLLFKKSRDMFRQYLKGLLDGICYKTV